MNKTSLALLLVLCKVSLLFAQTSLPDNNSGFYMRAGIGYAFPQAGQSYDPIHAFYSGTTNNPVSSNSTFTFSQDKISFSSGLHGSLALGYMFNKNVGVELSADMCVAARKYNYSGTTYFVDSASGIIGNRSVDQKSGMLTILSPSLVMQTAGDKWNLYTRLGFALPLNTDIDISVENAFNTGEIDIYTEKLKSKFTIGYNATAGVSYKVSGNMKVWAEMSLLSLALDADELDYVGLTVNQQNYLPQFAQNHPTVYLYKSSGTYPADNRTFAIPYSNMAFNMGLSWKFHKRTVVNHVTPHKYNRQ